MNREAIKKHLSAMKQWAEHGGTVWVCDGEWLKTTDPAFNTNFQYRVVPPAYEHAWQAYLDGVLRVRLQGKWQDWQGPAPFFELIPDDYRRKSWGLTYRMANGETVRIETLSPVVEVEYEA